MNEQHELPEIEPNDNTIYSSMSRNTRTCANAEVRAEWDEIAGLYTRYGRVLLDPVNAITLILFLTDPVRLRRERDFLNERDD